MMKRIACALLVSAAAVGFASVAIVGSASAERAKGERTAEADPAPNESAPSPERPIPADPHELDVAYAEVSLRLAKLDLQKMTDLQNRVRGSITASQYDRVSGLARVAEEILRLTKEGKSTRAAMNLIRAREAVRTAEHVWKTAQQVKVAAAAISETELARLRTMVEVEKLSLARAEVAAATDSELDDLAWENDQMRDEMQRLRYRFEALTARR